MVARENSTVAKQQHVIGIDLGTTFSAVSYLDRGGGLVTIPNAEDERTTSSVVLFEPEGAVCVGRRALRSAVIYPERVLDGVKRSMGQRFCEHTVAGRQITPVYVSSLILKKLRQDTENRIGRIAGAVITVPAYFDEIRRQATSEAGRIAGLNVIDILNEPTAAALAYGFEQYLQEGGDVGDMLMARPPLKPSTIMVYDLGGGTFDVSIIRVHGDDFNVLATAGEARLGGKDWDNTIQDYAAEIFHRKHGVDPRQNALARQELTIASEEAKRELSRQETTELVLKYQDLRDVIPLTRSQFEEMSQLLLYRTESRVLRVLKNASLTPEDIDRVLLVGGSTRMPQVHRMLQRVMGKKLEGSIAADEIVSHGAAIHAAMIAVRGKGVGPSVGNENVEATKSDSEDVFVDSSDTVDNKDMVLPPASSQAQATPFNTGLRGKVNISPRASTPNDAKPLDVGEQEFATIEFDLEVKNALKKIKTSNVNAHSLGVVIHSSKAGGDRVEVIIPQNTPLPNSYTRIFGTVVNNQKFVKVKVMEGESEDPSACIRIGECVVSPLHPGLKRGSPIFVTFTYDNSGRLHVQARDETSGKAANAVFHHDSALNAKTLAQAKTKVEKTTVC